MFTFKTSNTQHKTQNAVDVEIRLERRAMCQRDYSDTGGMLQKLFFELDSSPSLPGRLM